MPATTPLGIHYPLATDAPSGHTNMQTLATDVDSLLRTGGVGVNQLGTDAVTAAANISAWPVGVSIMVGTPAAGWPTGFSLIVGYKYATANMARTVIGIAGATHIHTEYWNGSGWTPSGAPFATAANAATIVAPGNTPSPSVAVTFPAGRFSVAPIVSLAMGSNTASYMCSFGGQTASGFNILMFHNTAGTNVAAASYGIHWHAMQMTPSAAGG
jgi:hypothetical protein